MISSTDLAKQVSTIENSTQKAEAGDKGEEDRAIGALKALLKEKVTTEVLVQTQVGKIVRKFTKSSCKPIAEAAKEVLDCWKGAVKNETVAKATEEKKEAEKPRDKGEPATTSKPSQEANRGAGAPAGTPLQPIKHDIKATGDEKRDRYINSIADLLSLELHRVEGADAAGVATEIESAVAKRYGLHSKDYQAKFRTLTFNLKDKDNWDLRGRVLLGEVTPSELVSMSEEQLASHRVKEELERLHKELIMIGHDQVLEKSVIHENATGARTQMYECGKCKKRDTTFYEKQTRSADEPMTVFITCLNCGNKWRMN